MKKVLVIINEDLAQMLLGRNTTLSYICAAIDLGHEVYIYNLDEDLIAVNLNARIKVIHLNQKNSANLVAAYQKENQKLKNLIDHQAPLKDFLSLSRLKVADVINTKLPIEKLKLSEVNLIIQRLEPMKSPFPPHGQANIDQILKKLKKLFPHLIFNCPINKKDKELPLILDRIYRGKNKVLATPTKKSALDDSKLVDKINNIAQVYSKIFNKSSSKKVVLKPNNSAQGLGVFAIELVENGLNLNAIKRLSIKDLLAMQIYQLNDDLSAEDLKKVVVMLCYVQSIKSGSFANLDQKIAAINYQKALKIAGNLYNDKILIQPFLEGIKFGDIRINLAKNNHNNFVVVGATLRRSVADDQNFTTSLTLGGSVGQSISSLKDIFGQKIAQKIIIDLIKKINLIIKTINKEPLKKSYQNCTEMGVDFILTGDDKTVMFGEANHHCQAVIPQAEALMGQDAKFYQLIKAGMPKKYDGGIAVTKQIIADQIAI